MQWKIPSCVNTQLFVVHVSSKDHARAEEPLIRLVKSLGKG